ncbi:MAG TPA: hypothetical protein VNY35_07195 [Solirubrobacteraceae bacterium]|jgi:hypothetical protein|nr:hypothetical protein [Solirubrobacteraceae bacterium]
MIRLPRPEPTIASRRSPRPARLHRLAIAGSLIAALGAAGCGSSGPKSTKTAAVPAITKAQLVAKANAICTTGNGPILAAAAKLAGHPSPAQVAAVVQNTYLPSIGAQIRAINALGVPPGEQAEITKLLDLAQADLNKLRSNPALVNTDVFGDFARAAHPYGLTACAPTS